MAFSDGGFKPRTFASIKQDKKAGTIHFEINQGKDDNGNSKPPLIKRDYSGRLKEVKIKNYEYEGKPKEKIQFIFVDGDSEVWIEAGWSIVSKGILNTIDGADSIGEVMIALYKNKKGYASAFVEVNGQKVGWKYQQTQLPAAEKKMVRGEEVFDDYEQIQFYKSKIIPEINSKIQNEFLVEAEMSEPKPNGTPPNSKNEKVSTSNAPEFDSSMDDLPFISPYNQHIPTMLKRRK